MTLRGQIVDLVRLSLLENTVECRAVCQVGVVKPRTGFADARSAARQDPVDFVTLALQQFGQVPAVLPRDSSDECSLASRFSHCSVRLRVHGGPVGAEYPDLAAPTQRSAKRTGSSEQCAVPRRQRFRRERSDQPSVVRRRRAACGFCAPERLARVSTFDSGVRRTSISVLMLISQSPSNDSHAERYVFSLPIF